jgi:hypothetical protein
MYARTWARAAVSERGWSRSCVGVVGCTVVSVSLGVGEGEGEGAVGVFGISVEGAGSSGVSISVPRGESRKGDDGGVGINRTW